VGRGEWVAELRQVNEEHKSEQRGKYSTEPGRKSGRDWRRKQSRDNCREERACNRNAIAGEKNACLDALPIEHRCFEQNMNVSLSILNPAREHLVAFLPKTKMRMRSTRTQHHQVCKAVCYLL
jgi:hypothetical protein